MTGAVPPLTNSRMRCYWTIEIAAGIGFAMVAAVLKKIEPRVSLAKYRVPVPFTVTGSAFATD